MSFEKAVLDSVATVLKTGTQAYFFNGTLFADCDPAQATKIETAVSKITNGGVIVSKVGNEFAYDFV
jgi:hypothetical protein